MTVHEVARTDEKSLANTVRLAQMVIEYLLYKQSGYKEQLGRLEQQLNECREKVVELVKG